MTLPGHDQSLFEIELAFSSSQTAELTRVILGGLDAAAIPTVTADQHTKGWQVPLGIGNPGFFESYEEAVANPPTRRTFYGFHLDSQDRWLDHHSVGVDGPLLHWDADEPNRLHLYLLSYERHALLNHIVITVPPDAGGRS